MDTEKIGTSTLTYYISRTDRLSPYISEGDKEPSWDGSIYIYKDKSRKKEDIEGRVLVQVKGKYFKNTIKKNPKYHIDSSDLHNYQKYGTAYFVVYFNEKENHIFYKLLYPVEIKKILLRIGNQKGTNIEFSPMPEIPEDLSTILLNFHNDCMKQISFVSDPNFKLIDIGQILNQQNTIKFNITCSADPKSFYTYLFNNEVYIYLQSPVEGFPDKPVDKLKIKEIESEVCEQVMIETKEYYKKYKIQRSKDQVIITLGKCINIIITENSGTTIKLKPNNTLNELILAFNFIIELSIKLVFNLGDKKLHIKEFKDINISEYEDQLSFLQNTKYVLDFLEVKEELDFKYNSLEDRSNSALRTLIEVIINKQCYNYSKWADIQRVNMQIYNIYLPLVFIKGENGEKDKFINELSETSHLYLKKGNNEIHSPQCILLNSADYQQISNLYYDQIFKSLTKFGNDTPLAERINISLLNMISAYDITLKAELLDLCIKLSDWILNNCNTLSIDIRHINYFQVIKRKRILSAEEQKILKLISLKGNTSDLKCAAYLLLDDKTNAEQYYNKIKNKKTFKSFPIYYFMNKQ